MNATTTPVPGRQCGECALCCKLPEIRALNKPANSWCQHCSTKKSCAAYESRPQACRDFYCGYMTQDGIPEAWHPLKSRMMVVPSGEHVFIHVDPARADAWKKAPYYAQLKQWARANNAVGKQVFINIAGRHIVVLPDRDEDIGFVADDETVSFTTHQTPSGPVTQVSKVKL